MKENTYQGSLLPEEWASQPLEHLATLSPIQHIQLDVFENNKIEFYLKREDLLDWQIGGNKLYKLMGHLQEWQKQEKKLPIATFGGAFSNHLYALASLGARLSIPTIGIIRGERAENLSPTLQDAEEMGMALYFVSRSDYRRRNDSEYKIELTQKIGQAYWVPEGGGGTFGAKGCAALAKGIEKQMEGAVDIICHACGTGSSLAGLISGASKHVRVQGFSVLKGYPGLADDVQSLLSYTNGNLSCWDITDEYHSGGYAKLPAYLVDFISDFYHKTDVLLDPVYTGKMIWGITKLAQKGYWRPGSRIVAVHSGGLQGWRGYPQQMEQCMAS